MKVSFFAEHCIIAVVAGLGISQFMKFENDYMALITGMDSSWAAFNAVRLR
jgi:hypothetical protein